MHKKRFWITSCILAAGFTMNMAGAVGAADAEKGELIFAQCEEYINVRSEADENSEVVAKLYNDGSATVEETEDNGWYKIKSGNAEGYVKAEYFATGEQAKEIADQVAYNVAVVNAEALNIRTAPSEESDVIDVAEQSQELEVVDTSGDWATVALGNDVYGFIHPDYCEYKTYYPTAVTLEEEAAREEAMRRAQKNEDTPSISERKKTIMDALNVEKTGWWLTSVKFKRVVTSPESGKCQYVDTTFTVKQFANSAMDAYNRIIDHLKNRADVDPRSQFPSARSANFEYQFMSENPAGDNNSNNTPNTKIHRSENEVQNDCIDFHYEDTKSTECLGDTENNIQE